MMLIRAGDFPAVSLPGTSRLKRFLSALKFLKNSQATQAIMQGRHTAFVHMHPANSEANRDVFEASL